MLLKSIGYVLSSLLLITLCSAKVTPVAKKVDQRIIGGKPTTIARVPYLVQVWVARRFACGGTLISARFVVSAAHCVQNVMPRQLTIVGGATSLSDRGVVRKVQKVIKPRNFSLNTMTMDVAVFKLFRAMSGPNIRAIALQTQPIRVGSVLKVSGWGVVGENQASPSNTVRTVNVPVISKSKCRTDYARQSISLTGTMFCAAAPRKDSCAGDSGGPAVYKGRLTGIVSFGIGCGRSNYPGVYTGVPSVRKLMTRALRQ